MTRTHPTKIDWWLGLLIGVAAAGSVAAAAGVLATQPWTPGNLLPLLVGPLFFAATVWTMFNTAYDIGGADLLVRAGPFRWRIPLSAIESVTPTNNPLSSPAFSLDRLMVRYRNEGGAERWVMISPRDKAGFLADLAAASPGLVVTDGAAGRRATA